MECEDEDGGGAAVVAGGAGGGAKSGGRHGATAIEFLNPENLGIADRLDELVPQRVYRTDRHWVGDINAELVLPGILSRVTDSTTGEEKWHEVPLYTGYVVARGAGLRYPV